MEIHAPYDQHIEVHKYYAGTIFGVVVLALALEALLPVYFRSAAILELPLLITIYFGLSRRNPSSGLLLGMVIGLAQDSLGHTPFGMYGIAKTFVGFFASSLGVKLDTESVGTRLLVVSGFYVVHQVVYFTIARGLVDLNLNWSWSRELWSAGANAVLGVFLFVLMDRLKQRA